MKYDPSKGLGAMDKILLRGASANKSGAELSAMTNGVIPAADAMLRVDAILSSRNWLTEANKEKLLLDDMYALKDSLTNQASVGNLDAAKVLRATLVDIGNRLDKRAKATDLDLNTLYGNQGAIMSRAYDIALSYMKGALRGEVDPVKWDELANEALTHAQAELTQHEAVTA